LFVESGWLARAILENGPFGLAFLRPLNFSAAERPRHVEPRAFWTLFFNLGAFIAISLLTRPDESEAEQATRFVDVFAVDEEPVPRKRMTKAPVIMEFVDLMTKFIGEKQAHAAIARYLGDQQVGEKGSLSEYEIPTLKRFTERVLAGAVGAASAGIIVNSYLAAKGANWRMFSTFSARSPSAEPPAGSS
jgi:hypothetical protein